MWVGTGAGRGRREQGRIGGGWAGTRELRQSFSRSQRSFDTAVGKGIAKTGHDRGVIHHELTERLVLTFL